MSKFRIFKKAFGKIGIGAAAGGTAAAYVSPGFARGEETNQGTKIGAGVGAMAAVIPSIIKNKTVREMVKTTGRVIFRRVRGRIIRIKV